MNEYVVFEGDGGQETCEISEEEFDKAKMFGEVVVTAFSIEEAFSLVARSYVDLEKIFMSASLEWSLENEDYAPHNDFFDNWREAINLQLLSFLTASGVYTEKMERIAKNGTISGFNWDLYDPDRREVFDSNFYYRVMCAVRNYSIHAALPISGFPVAIKNEAASGRLNEDEPSRQRTTCSPHIRTQPLLSAKSIKKATRDEIKDLKADGVDLKMFTRGYVEGLYALHRVVRKLTEKSLNEAIGFFKTMEDRLSQKKGEKCRLAHIGEKGQGIETALYIDTARLSRIFGKRRDWQKLRLLRQKYVSSETTRQKGIYLGEVENIWIQG